MNQKEFFTASALMRGDISAAQRFHESEHSDDDLPIAYRCTGHKYEAKSPILPPPEVHLA